MPLTQGAEGFGEGAITCESWRGYRRPLGDTTAAPEKIPGYPVYLRKQYWFTGAPVGRSNGDVVLNNTNAFAIIVRLTIGSTVVVNNAMIAAGASAVYNMINLASANGLAFPQVWYEEHGPA